MRKRTRGGVLELMWANIEVQVRLRYEFCGESRFGRYCPAKPGYWRVGE